MFSNTRNFNTDEVELSEIPSVTDLVNSVIKVLNDYILINKTSLTNNSARKENLLYLMRKMCHENLIQEILSTENLSKLLPNLIPTINKIESINADKIKAIQLIKETFHQMLLYVNSISKFYFISPNQLRGNLISLLQTNERWLERFQNNLTAEKKSLIIKNVKENQIFNEQNSPLYKLPDPIIKLILSFLDTKPRFSLRRASPRLFDKHYKEEHWKRWIIEKFHFTPEQVSLIKNKDESYYQLYLRVDALNELCIGIRETEREIRFIKLDKENLDGHAYSCRATEISNYKQSIQSIKSDLLDAILNGYAKTKHILRTTIEERNRVQQPENIGLYSQFYIG